MRKRIGRHLVEADLAQPPHLGIPEALRREVTLPLPLEYAVKERHVEAGAGYAAGHGMDEEHIGAGRDHLSSGGNANFKFHAASSLLNNPAQRQG